MRRLRSAVAAATATATSFLLFAGLASAATPNIINGSQAGSTLGMVARIFYNDGPGSFTCSGTVVASNAILTAGHCAEDPDTGVVDSASGYQVLTGTQSIAVAGQVSGVGQVIPYPNYDPSTKSGDAAILILTTPTTAAPVALATDSSDGYLYNGGTGATITGWGVDDDYGDTPSELLYGSDVVQSPSYCIQQADNLNAEFDPTYQLCAVDAPSNYYGTCHGDSGGPILAYVSGAWIELGITSFGPSNCNTAQPGYFTRTDSIASWIQNEIRANPPAAATPPPTATPVAPPVPVATTPTAPAPISLISYVGQTSQHKYISLKLAGTRTTINGFSFGFTLRCTRHRPLSYTYTEPAADNTTWPLSNGAFDRRFSDNTGERYQLDGTITTAGALGTLSTTWHSRKYGRCAGGVIHWSASPAQ